MTTTDPVRVTITIEQRGDGGLNVYSDDLPGMRLSCDHSRTVVLANNLMNALKARMPELFEPIKETET